MDAPHGASPTRTLIMHPITQEIYQVPPEALEHDFCNPLDVEWNRFQEMGNQGCLCAETFLGLLRQKSGSISTTRVLVVRLQDMKNSVRFAHMHAWASRMTTTVPDSDEFPAELRGASIGGNFIWIWRLSRSFNAWCVRAELRRTNKTMVSTGIDEKMPTIRYATSNPGLQLGPDDVPGCRHVAYCELTAKERFFISAIKPQQTSFRRRIESDRWGANLEEIVNAAQNAFADKPETFALTTNWTVRNKSAAVAATSRKRTLDAAILAPMESETANIYQKYLEPPGHAQRRAPNDPSAASTRWKSAQQRCIRHLERGDAAIAAAKRRRWNELPHELLLRIFSIVIRDAMAAPSVDATELVLMRLCQTSKGVAAFVRSFVGIQLATTKNDVNTMLSATKRLPEFSPAEVGARARALGLQPEHVWALNARPLRTVHGWTLPKTPALAPTLGRYFVIRRLKERQYQCERVTKPKADGPSTYQAVVADLNATNVCHIEQLAAHLDERAAPPDKIKAAGECNSDFMMRAAGT